MRVLARQHYVSLCLGFSSLLMPKIGLSQIEDLLGAPHLLLGRAGVAGPASAESVAINPAHAAVVPSTEARLGWGLHRTSFQQRYPGFPTHSSTETGLFGPPSPGFVYVPNRMFGLGGIVIPFPVAQDIAINDLPLIVFGQENLVDVEGQGTLKGLVDFNLGVRLGKVALGANLKFASLEGQVSLRAAGSVGNSLADINFAIQTLGLRLGMRLEITRKITLGLVTTVFSSQTTNMSFDSALAGALEGEDQPVEPGGPVKSSTFANPIRVGVGAQVVRNVLLMVDIEHKRPVQRKDFSTVDLVEKPKDVYATTNFHSGVQVRLPNNDEVLAGVSFRGSEIGQGQAGPEGKSGFGFSEIVMNQGNPPSTPSWDIGGGYRWHLGKRVGGRRSRVRQMSVEAGVVYGETSIGIDENGEQPGAYLVRRVQIPASFSYRF